MKTIGAVLSAWVILVVAIAAASAQTTAGSGTVIVVPVTAQTTSFASEITVYNPNAGSLTLDVAFYEANNSPGGGGGKVCADMVVPANRSVQFTLAGQCTLNPAVSHFGLLVLTDLAGVNPFYGYARVQNPQGIGFSVEGFPADNFNDQVSHATGLKKTTGGLIFQTNCFVGSLAEPATYTLKLFNDSTGAQIGTTISGSLSAFEQVRYLDVLGPGGVNAGNADYANVRAEFASNPPATLVGFCTVQDNTSFGADFRIGKSYGGPGTVVSVTQGTGIVLTPNPLTSSGTIAVDPTVIQSRVSGTCPAGSSIRAIAQNGTVTCETDDVGGTGTVTSVATGAGLTGGPITGSGTISVANGGITATMLAGNGCGAGQVLKWSGSAWACGNDIDTLNAGTVTSVGTGTGLTGGPITGSGTISVAAGGIGTTQIASNAVTQAKLSAAGGSAGQYLSTDGANLQWAAPPTTATLTPINPLGNTITIVDDTGDVGQYTSITLGADGLPVISYYDAISRDLKVAKCADAACSGSKTITTVESADSVGRYTSITLGADGLPVISYEDQTRGRLKIAKCGNAACSGASAIAYRGLGGTYTSITLAADGLPIISLGGSLTVVKCGNASCAYSDAEQLDSIGQYTSITLGADGFPVISYYDTINLDLKVAKCANTACTAHGMIAAVDVAIVGPYTSITLGADGLPVISYTAYESLRVAKCVNPDCTGSSMITTVDNTGDVGQHASITLGTDGLPVISYYDATNGDLKVAKCANAACTGSSMITTVDSAGDVGQYTSITLGTDGLPVISYYDATNGALKVAKCSSQTCVPYVRRR